MALPDYPAELPPPELSDYRLQHAPTFRRTDLESGLAVQGRGFSSVPTQVTVQWIFHAGEFALFEGWFRYQIDDGAAWFSGPLKTAQGVVDLTQRFAAMYRARPLGPGHWRVDASLEIQERQTLPPA